MDVSAYLESARKISLLIGSLGVIALQIGWSERIRQTRLADFGYVERVLGVGDEVQARWAETSFVWSGGSEIGEKLDGRISPASLVDASGQCDLQLWKGLPGQDVYVSMPVYQVAGDRRLRSLDEELDIGRYFPAIFQAGCRGGKTANPAFVLLRLPNSYGDAQWAYLLPTNRLVGLGFPEKLSRDIEKSLDPNLEDLLRQAGARPRAVDASGVSATDEGVLELMAGPGVFVTRSVLEALVRETAHRELGGYFSKADVAIKSVLNARDESPELMGFKLAPLVTVLGLPVVLIALVVLLWHRLHHLAENGGPYEEPWILIQPKGPVEVGVSVIWLLILVSTTFSVGYAAYYFQDTIYASLLSEDAPTQIVHFWVLAAVSTIPLGFLAASFHELWRIYNWAPAPSGSPPPSDTGGTEATLA